MQQYTTLIFIALLALVFYFLILRPQRKRQQARVSCRRSRAQAKISHDGKPITLRRGAGGERRRPRQC